VKKTEKKYTLNEVRELEEKAIEKGGEYIKVDRERESINLVTIGHVDAGKSTLSGRILVETGEVDESEIKNMKKKLKINIEKVGI